MLRGGADFNYFQCACPSLLRRPKQPQNNVKTLNNQYYPHFAQGALVIGMLFPSGPSPPDVVAEAQGARVSGRAATCVCVRNVSDGGILSVWDGVQVAIKNLF